jgi:hypothetical protein
MPHDVDSVTFIPKRDRRQLSDRRAQWRGGRRASDVPSIPDLALRIQAEYFEQPGLRLSLPQAARLWHVDAVRCESVLLMLVQHGSLARTPQGFYVALPRSSHQLPVRTPAVAKRSQSA